MPPVLEHVAIRYEGFRQFRWEGQSDGPAVHPGVARAPAGCAGRIGRRAVERHQAGHRARPEDGLEVRGEECTVTKQGVVLDHHVKIGAGSSEQELR